MLPSRGCLWGRHSCLPRGAAATGRRCASRQTGMSAPQSIRGSARSSLRAGLSPNARPGTPPRMPPRPYLLEEANYRQLLDDRPNVAVLPWGATEAHNYHLPHGTDVIEATAVAHSAGGIAHGRG